MDYPKVRGRGQSPFTWGGPTARPTMAGPPVTVPACTWRSEAERLVTVLRVQRSAFRLSIYRHEQCRVRTCAPCKFSRFPCSQGFLLRVFVSCVSRHHARHLLLTESYQRGDGGFVIEFGGVCYQDTYPMYLTCIVHVSCMYLDVSRQDTSRYIEIQQDTFVSVTLAIIGNVSYLRISILLYDTFRIQ
jgi:hypothetical protein